MSTDAPVNMFDGELAALQRRRELDSLCMPPVASILSNLAEVADEFGVPGAGLFARALKSGQTPVEKVVEQVEAGAYVEISRVWKHLEGQDERWKEFDARLKNQEAQSAYVAAILHGLRTSDPQKQSRIGVLTISCLYANDTEPEVLDDMMRAVVELKSKDIHLLERIHKRQQHILSEAQKWPMQWYDNVRRDWQAWTVEEAADFRQGTRSFFELKASLSRLAAFGFIVAVPPVGTSNSPGADPYAFLLDGKNFLERLMRQMMNEL